MKVYETKPFKVAYLIYGEALVYATNEATANMKIHGMTSRQLVEKSLTTEREIIDTEADLLWLAGKEKGINYFKKNT